MQQAAVARFKVAWVAEVTARGTVIAGEILDGKLRVGGCIVGPAGVPGLPLAIVGVEFADNLSTRVSWVCLVVPPPPVGPAGSLLKEALTGGTVLEVVSSDEPAGHQS